MTNHEMGYDISIHPYPETFIQSGYVLKNKNYSYFGFDIKLRRHAYHYLWTYILPSFCVVLISGISFLITPSAIPGRLTLLITLFLVQIQVIKDVQGKSKHF